MEAKKKKKHMIKVGESAFLKKVLGDLPVEKLQKCLVIPKGGACYVYARNVTKTKKVLEAVDLPTFIDDCLFTENSAGWRFSRLSDDSICYPVTIRIHDLNNNSIYTCDTIKRGWVENGIIKTAFYKEVEK